MKLIIAIVQDEDSSKLVSKLMQNGFSVTKLATTGGFLKAGNTTLLLGVDEQKIQDAVTAIETRGNEAVIYQNRTAADWASHLVNLAKNSLSDHEKEYLSYV